MLSDLREGRFHQGRQCDFLNFVSKKRRAGAGARRINLEGTDKVGKLRVLLQQDCRFREESHKDPCQDRTAKMTSSKHRKKKKKSSKRAGPAALHEASSKIEPSASNDVKSSRDEKYEPYFKQNGDDEANLKLVIPDDQVNYSFNTLKSVVYDQKYLKLCTVIWACCHKAGQTDDHIHFNDPIESKIGEIVFKTHPCLHNKGGAMLLHSLVSMFSKCNELSDTKVVNGVVKYIDDLCKSAHYYMIGQNMVAVITSVIPDWYLDHGFHMLFKILALVFKETSEVPLPVIKDEDHKILISEFFHKHQLLHSYQNPVVCAMLSLYLDSNENPQDFLTSLSNLLLHEYKHKTQVLHLPSPRCLPQSELENLKKILKCELSSNGLHYLFTYQLKKDETYEFSIPNSAKKFKQPESFAEMLEWATYSIVTYYPDDAIKLLSDFYGYLLKQFLTKNEYFVRNADSISKEAAMEINWRKLLAFSDLRSHIWLKQAQIQTYFEAQELFPEDIYSKATSASDHKTKQDVELSENVSEIVEEEEQEDLNSLMEYIEGNTNYKPANKKKNKKKIKARLQKKTEVVKPESSSSNKSAESSSSCNSSKDRKYIEKSEQSQSLDCKENIPRQQKSSGQSLTRVTPSKNHDGSLTNSVSSQELKKETLQQQDKFLQNSGKLHENSEKLFEPTYYTEPVSFINYNKFRNLDPEIDYSNPDEVMSYFKAPDRPTTSGVKKKSTSESEKNSPGPSVFEKSASRTVPTKDIQSTSGVKKKNTSESSDSKKNSPGPSVFEKSANKTVPTKDIQSTSGVKKRNTSESSDSKKNSPGPSVFENSANKTVSTKDIQSTSGVKKKNTSESSDSKKNSPGPSVFENSANKTVSTKDIQSTSGVKKKNSSESSDSKKNSPRPSVFENSANKTVPTKDIQSITSGVKKKNTSESSDSKKNSPGPSVFEKSANKTVPMKDIQSITSGVKKKNTSESSDSKKNSPGPSVFENSANKTVPMKDIQSITSGVKKKNTSESSDSKKNSSASSVFENSANKTVPTKSTNSQAQIGNAIKSGSINQLPLMQTKSVPEKNLELKKNSSQEPEEVPIAKEKLSSKCEKVNKKKDSKSKKKCAGKAETENMNDTSETMMISKNKNSSKIWLEGNQNFNVERLNKKERKEFHRKNKSQFKTPADKFSEFPTTSAVTNVSVSELQESSVAESEIDWWDCAPKQNKTEPRNKRTEETLGDNRLKIIECINPPVHQFINETPETLISILSQESQQIKLPPDNKPGTLRSSQHKVFHEGPEKLTFWNQKKVIVNSSLRTEELPKSIWDPIFHYGDSRYETVPAWDSQVATETLSNTQELTNPKITDNQSSNTQKLPKCLQPVTDNSSYETALKSKWGHLGTPVNSEEFVNGLQEVNSGYNEPISSWSSQDKTEDYDYSSYETIPKSIWDSQEEVSEMKSLNTLPKLYSKCFENKVFSHETRPLSREKTNNLKSKKVRRESNWVALKVADVTDTQDISKSNNATLETNHDLALNLPSKVHRNADMQSQLQSENFSDFAEDTRLEFTRNSDVELKSEKLPVEENNTLKTCIADLYTKFQADVYELQHLKENDADINFSVDKEMKNIETGFSFSALHPESYDENSENIEPSTGAFENPLVLDFHYEKNFETVGFNQQLETINEETEPEVFISDQKSEFSECDQDSTSPVSLTQIKNSDSDNVQSFILELGLDPDSLNQNLNNFSSLPITTEQDLSSEKILDEVRTKTYQPSDQLALNQQNTMTNENEISQYHSSSDNAKFEIMNIFQDLNKLEDILSSFSTPTDQVMAQFEKQVQTLDRMKVILNNLQHIRENVLILETTNLQEISECLTENMIQSEHPTSYNTMKNHHEIDTSVKVHPSGYNTLENHQKIDTSVKIHPTGTLENHQEIDTPVKIHPTGTLENHQEIDTSVKIHPTGYNTMENHQEIDTSVKIHPTGYNTLENHQEIDTPVKIHPTGTLENHQEIDTPVKIHPTGYNTMENHQESDTSLKIHPTGTFENHQEIDTLVKIHPTGYNTMENHQEIDTSVKIHPTGYNTMENHQESDTSLKIHPTGTFENHQEIDTSVKIPTEIYENQFSEENFVTIEHTEVVTNSTEINTEDSSIKNEAISLLNQSDQVHTSCSEIVPQNLNQLIVTNIKSKVTQNRQKKTFTVKIKCKSSPKANKNSSLYFMSSIMKSEINELALKLSKLHIFKPSIKKSKIIENKNWNQLYLSLSKKSKYYMSETFLKNLNPEDNSRNSAIMKSHCKGHQRKLQLIRTAKKCTGDDVRPSDNISLDDSKNVASSLVLTRQQPIILECESAEESFKNSETTDIHQITDTETSVFQNSAVEPTKRPEFSNLNPNAIEFTMSSGTSFSLKPDATAFIPLQDRTTEKHLAGASRCGPKQQEATVIIPHQSPTLEDSTEQKRTLTSEENSLCKLGQNVYYQRYLQIDPHLPLPLIYPPAIRFVDPIVYQRSVNSFNQNPPQYTPQQFHPSNLNLLNTNPLNPNLHRGPPNSASVQAGSPNPVILNSSVLPNLNLLNSGTFHPNLHSGPPTSAFIQARSQNPAIFNSSVLPKPNLLNSGTFHPNLHRGPPNSAFIQAGSSNPAILNSSVLPNPNLLNSNPLNPNLHSGLPNSAFKQESPSCDLLSSSSCSNQRALLNQDNPESVKPEEKIPRGFNPINITCLSPTIIDAPALPAVDVLIDLGNDDVEKGN